jgi:hypothetical protein
VKRLNMHGGRARLKAARSHRFIVAAAFAVVIGMIGVGGAGADSAGPITFESPTYTTGGINTQQGWSDTGGYDAAIVSVSAFPAATGYGFGAQALRISDAVTSGSFGDQTFSPGLAHPAGEAQPQSHFDASFSIGSATGAQQVGQHLSVSPDDGNGSRMSYLRFEDQASGIDVWFDDVTTGGSFGTPANFTDTKIATLAYGSAHTASFAIDFKPGAGNDVVTIALDGLVTATGTTWEDYYRYDPEQVGNGNVVPTTSKLIFREGGTNDGGNAGRGYLIDGVSLSSSTPPPPCSTTGFSRDGIPLTAKLVNPSSTVTGAVDASGCNIGVYYGPGHTGGVSGANVSGASYFGVVADGAAVNVTGSAVHNIGEAPFNGAQHGNGLYYTGGATGTISGNTVSRYQKNGITAVGGSSVLISGNTVSGEGAVDYIAQNGIEVGSGATGTVQDNSVSGNAYKGPNGASSGGVLVFGGPAFGAGVPYTTGVTVNHNTLTGNDVGIYLYNADGNGNPPKSQTKNGAVNNTITNTQRTNTTGFSPTCGYQAGVSELGTKDNIVNNKITGVGYTPASGDCAGTLPLFIRAIDTDGSVLIHVKNNK